MSSRGLRTGAGHRAGGSKKNRQDAPPATSALKQALKQPVVNYFETAKDGVRHRVQDDAGADEAEVEINRRIKRLQEDLKSLETGSATPLDIAEAHVHPEREGQAPLHELIAIPEDKFDENSRRNIQKLNKYLMEASEGSPRPKCLMMLWKNYSLCRKALHKSPTDIPPHAWTILWLSFTTNAIHNTDRMPRTKGLAEDMKKAGVELQPVQEVMYLEALFQCGEHEDAIRQWESSADVLGNDESTFTLYTELGVRMFSHHGQPARAQAIADRLFNSLKYKDARILIPIIQAWLQSSDQSAVQTAWGLYIRLKHISGPNMTMEDYDTITAMFLAAKHSDLALAVFKDMMITGSTSSKDEDSVTLYKKAMKTVGNLHSTSMSPIETNWISYHSFTILPIRFQNKFFYASWIKKLLGDGDVDGAEEVVNLMYKRGVRPDSKHLNGLVGAWLRTGTALNQKKAEELAWRMIKVRLELVENRDRSTTLESHIKMYESDGLQGFYRPGITGALVPPAQLETFIVLLQHYQRRGKHDIVQDLERVLKTAKIQPTTLFMNILLHSYLQSHRKQKAWTTYLSLIGVNNITPDWETFSLLWEHMKVHVDPIKTRQRAGFPDCRRLFTEMAKMAPQSTKQGPLPQELYDRMILCFGLSDDQVGTAVALHALRKLFNAYPSSSTARSVVMQLARAGHENVAGIRPRRLNLNSTTKKRIADVTEILEMMRARRAELRAEAGRSEEMNENESAEESLLILSDLLRHVVQTRVDGGTAPDEYSHMSDENNSAMKGRWTDVSKYAQKAAIEMGLLGDIHVWKT